MSDPRNEGWSIADIVLMISNDGNDLTEWEIDFIEDMLDLDEYNSTQEDKIIEIYHARVEPPTGRYGRLQDPKEY